MEPAIAQELASDAVLAVLDTLDRSPDAAPRNRATMAAAGFGPDLIAAALTQVTLRHEAAERIGPAAATMLLTRPGLEQATRASVARLHADRYLRAGISTVVDLTAGLGLDAWALAAAGLDVTALEMDPATAIFTAHNLARFPDATVRCADAMDIDIATLLGTTPGSGGRCAIYADPARRTPAGARITNPQHYRPALHRLTALTAITPHLGVKVGPGIDHRAALAPSELAGIVPEAQWVSISGDVVEAGLWFGGLADSAPGRSALITAPDPAAPGELLTTTLRAATPAPLPATAPVGPLGEYLWEPDGAIIRAGLVAELAEQEGLHAIDPRIAYLTGDHAIATRSGVSVASGYRIIDTVPLHLKKLRSYLAARDVGPVTIKKRGADIVPERLRQQLGLRGSNPATLVVTRVAGLHQVLIVEPWRPQP